MKEPLSLSAAQATLTNAPIGILLLDADKKILWHNATLGDLLNLNAEQISATDSDNLSAELRSMLLEPPETIFLQIDDEQRWLNCHCEPNKESGGYTHFYTDITNEKRLQLERDRLEEDLRQLSTRDTVTGLPNRLALLQGLEPLVSRSRRYANPLSLIMLRVTFDNCHDNDAQAAVWSSVGGLLKDQMRWADIIGRFDGSDFLLILPETAGDAAEQLVSKIQKLVAEAQITGSSGEAIPLAVYCTSTCWGKGDDSNLMLKRLAEQVHQAQHSD